MNAVTDLSRIFRSAVVLIVEDELTRQYLQRLGFVAPIGIHVAGGKGGVRALTEAARADGLTHVYGIVDQDYGPSNFERWRTMGSDKLFVLPVHEAENLLLDDAALESVPSNNLRRTQEAIRECLSREAGQLTWTVALRHVLASLRRSLMDGFPEHKTVRTLEDALQFIVQSIWFRDLSSSIPWMGSKAAINAKLADEQTKATSALASGAWRETFSGKELFRIARGYILQPPNSRPGMKPPTASQLDVTLAQEVAEWQVSNSAKPECMTVLREVIRQRHGV
jgi:hypothetical protein